ncbi:MAG: diacylglycerol kinase family protein [Bacteroidota bacterium]
MNEIINQHLLFVINPCSGVGCINWEERILAYLAPFQHQLTFFNLTKNTQHNNLLEEITKLQPNIVIAVGGDGTIRFVATCLLNINIPLGIIPAGSANGLAMELGMTNDLAHSLDTILTGFKKTIHAIEINHQICIHLSDIGLNAHAIRKFEMQQNRGFWGYFLASLKVLWNTPKIKASLEFNNQVVNTKAELIVIANCTMYGTGAIINPIGVLNDTKFEIVVVKIISLFEIFKMVFSHAKFDPDKTVVYQTSKILIKTNKKAHFQMDGEYLGKVNQINATIIPKAISVIVPVQK